MPTQAALQARDAAKLEALISQLMTAVRTENTSQLDRVLDAMVDFSARTPFPELQIQAAKAQSAASKTIVEEALLELAEIADGLTAAGAGFKAAAMIAENGKEELLFPALAGAAERGLELVKEFQNAVQAVRENVGDTDNLHKITQALEELLKAFNSLKKKVGAASA